MEEKKLTIGQLAERVGMRTSALRYYEEEGLLKSAERSDSGYRLYDSSVERELRFIQRAQQLGFSLADIRILLKGWREGNLEEEAFIETAESRYLALERRVTRLLALQHELGLFLQDIYQSASQKVDGTPALLISQLIEHICLQPMSGSASLVFDRLMQRAGCLLTTEEGNELMRELRGQHIHIWEENQGYSILVVSEDPKVEKILERFAELAANCKAHEHTHQVPQVMHNSEGYLMKINGDYAFIIARMFLEVGSPNTHYVTLEEE
jgi:MerR family copper efflux transcriptional regulator